jgi:hypothetical protein
MKTNEKKCSHLITKDGFGHGQLDASGLKHLHIPQKLWVAKHSLFSDHDAIKDSAHR